MNMTNLVLIRILIATNQIPGYFSGPNSTPTQVGPDGYLPPFTAVNAILIAHPPRTEVVTNYVLGIWQGTNAVELITVEKR